MSDRHLEAREKSLLKRVDQLRNKLLERDPWQLAQNIGAVYDGHTFHLEVWQQPIVLSSRDFVAIDVQSGRPGDAVTQAVLAYHLVTADGTPPTSRWIAFRELADGKFYASAFQSYTGTRLAHQFGDDVGAFEASARRIGASPISLADSGLRIQVLPQLPLAVVCWLGDEDFETSYRLLFDASADHQLPTDGCAILGSVLTSKLCAEQSKRITET